MPQYKDFLLPDVGEGLTEADILSWSVAPGDTVVVNQTLVEVETAKAAVELPSPFAGVVRTLHAEAGDTVEVGRPIITIDVDPTGAVQEPAGGSSAEAAETGAARAEPPAAPEPEAELDAPKREAVLVGYGVSTGRASRRMRRSQPMTEPTPTAQPSFSRPLTEAAILAKPPVRKLAKDLGIDLGSVMPTGPNGSVSREDIKSASENVDRSSGTGAREERIPVRGVRKHTAAAMVASAFTAPHVSEFVAVDVTAMMELRERVGARREFAGVRISPLLFVAKAVLWAARRTPMINASWAADTDEIVVKNYVNLGIAAATDRGLIVPNIKDADQLSLLELARALGSLTDVARAGRTTPADMSGGTFTITNIGVFGIDAGTPILNPGEAAILAVGAIRRMPWVVIQDGVETIAPRSILQLSVSFDHRIIDGQQGSEFLADVA
ncbi:MAG: catalytic domain of component of various dehydrogenase complexe, partial [Pseudonocardiales bacterium]|nr:catalytic domain of component of various dehydrogenase complexe [Pseudonocardiales bacterium]